MLLLSRLWGIVSQPIRAFISFINSHLILLLLDLRLEDGDETVVIVQLFLQRKAQALAYEPVLLMLPMFSVLSVCAYSFALNTATTTASRTAPRRAAVHASAYSSEAEYSEALEDISEQLHLSLLTDELDGLMECMPDATVAAKLSSSVLPASGLRV